MNDSEILFEQLLNSDKRYTREAYEFIQQTLALAQKALNKETHITAKSVLEYTSIHALNQYGPMAKFVLSEWGINKCTDFGNIIFNLVSIDFFKKSEEDNYEDFSHFGYDFDEIFVKPYQPKQK